MFIQYLKHNCKTHPIQYILLILSIVFMLVVSVIANGIMLENISDGYAQLQGHYCGFTLDEGIKISEIRDDFNEFLEKMPVEISYITIHGRGNDMEIIYFPDNDDMKAWFDDFESLDKAFTEEQYLNHEKVAIVGTDLWPEYPPHTYVDDDHILLDGEEYRIIGKFSSGYPAIVLWGAEPDYAKVGTLDIHIKDYPSRAQMNEVNQQMCDTLIKGRKTMFEPNFISTDDLLATRKTVSNIVISVFVQIIAAFNALLLFKYMLDLRKKYFAVMRLCGFGKSVCVKYSFGELIVVSGISAAITCVVVELLRPVLARYFEIFRVMFDTGHMAVFALSFLAAAALVFAVYILPSLGKSVTRELREM